MTTEILQKAEDIKAEIQYLTKLVDSINKLDLNRYVLEKCLSEQDNERIQYYHNKFKYDSTNYLSEKIISLNKEFEKL